MAEASTVGARRLARPSKTMQSFAACSQRRKICSELRVEFPNPKMESGRLRSKRRRQRLAIGVHQGFFLRMSD